MSKLAPLGIKKLEGIHYYVRDLERSRRFYCDRMDFSETARSTPELEAEGRQKSAVFQAGNCLVVCSQPLGSRSRPVPHPPSPQG